MRANTDWFKNLKWGAFIHYLANDKISAEDWNRQVGAFDVEGFADQLSTTGVSYCFITLGQNSGHFCSPNQTYDSIVGIQPSKCSKRDLVADLYDALSKRGIKLLVYLPSGAPDCDAVAMKKLDWHSNPQNETWRLSHAELDENGQPWGSKNVRLAAFQIKWQSVIAEWSKRWGKKVHGWWFDGCYYADTMYRHDDGPNFASFAAAAKAGNPDSIVAFNPGVKVPIICLTKYEDYTAGEISDALPAVCGRWVDGAQLHILSYLGDNWGAGNLRFSDELVVAYTKYVNSHDGVITWDAPTKSNGLIPDEFLGQLKKIGDSVKSVR